MIGEFSKPSQFLKKSICVENHTVGVTGKKPHVNNLAEWLSDSFDTAILNRGYGRKTYGFLVVNSNNSDSEFSNKPLFCTTHYQEKVHVAVCEKRTIGVQHIQICFQKTN